MRARIQPEPIVAAAALTLAIAASAWWLLNDPEAAPLERPTYRGDPVQIITSSLPAIGDFDREYSVNDENPFVPQLQRAAERAQIARNRTKKPTPTSAPVEVAEVPVPQLKFPPAAARRANAPDCVGVVGSAKGDTLLVRMPGSNDTVAIAIGDAVPPGAAADQQWTFVGLEPGGIARFRDPAGSEELFPIGSLALVPPKSDQPAATTAPAIQQRAPQQAPKQTPSDQPRSPKRQRPGPSPGGWAPQAPRGGAPQLPGSDRPQGWTPRPPSEVPPPPK